MQKIAIIGAGISGLFVANLFKENPNYQVTIYEKDTSINIDEGYGIQLSTNSIKHLNRLENVLARKGLANKFFDAIMLDANENICDCARSSLFIRYGKNLFTSSNKRYGIHGVTKKIIEKNIKKLNLTINYSPLKLDQLKEADEVIVTNSIFEITT